MTQALPDWLTRRVALAARRVALISPAQRWTWAELDGAAQQLADDLAQQGIHAGDRVATLLSNGAPYVILIHALIKLRAILVPLNTRLTVAELEWQTRTIRARALIGDPQHADQLAQIGAQLPTLLALEVQFLASQKLVVVRYSTSVELLSAPPVFPIDLLDLNTVQCIMHTSGTTGKPKGVQLTYGNHWWSTLGSTLNLGHQSSDCWLLVLPLFHIGGLAIVFRSVITGAPLVIHERFDPVLVSQTLDTEAVTLVSLVAVMLERLLEARAERRFPPILRTVLLGGGPAPRPLLERCAVQGIPVVQTYGMTETASQAVTLDPREALLRLGSAGKPLLPVELRITEQGAVLPPGAIGEIELRGPIVTPGYADLPEATATSQRDGWWATGDLGYCDAEGYLFVVDRRTDLIISGGENIYPAEVEAVLREHPAVADVAVIGEPDAQWGQQVVAYIVLTLGVEIEASELLAFCAARLARYKLPRQIVFRGELPRTVSGKLQRHALRKG
jgi:O-succinylbenzoic acid--CoA ligase